MDCGHLLKLVLNAFFFLLSVGAHRILCRIQSHLPWYYGSAGISDQVFFVDNLRSTRVLGWVMMLLRRVLL